MLVATQEAYASCHRRLHTYPGCNVELPRNDWWQPRPLAPTRPLLEQAWLEQSSDPPSRLPQSPAFSVALPSSGPDPETSNVGRHGVGPHALRLPRWEHLAQLQDSQPDCQGVHAASDVSDTVLAEQSCLLHSRDPHQKDVPATDPLRLGRLGRLSGLRPVAGRKDEAEEVRGCPHEATEALHDDSDEVVCRGFGEGNFPYLLGE